MDASRFMKPDAPATGFMPEPPSSSLSPTGAANTLSGETAGTTSYDNASEASSPQQNNETAINLQSQYNTSKQSLEYLSLSIAALLFSYTALYKQTQQLGAAVAGDENSLREKLNVFPLQFSSASIFLYTLTYFYCLSQNQLASPFQSPVDYSLAQYNHLANSLVLLAAMIRIYVLLLAEFGQNNQQQTESLETNAAPAV